MKSVRALDGRIAACQEQISDVVGTIKTLATKIDHLENRSRRSNLIIYGIPEEENKSNKSRIFVTEELSKKHSRFILLDFKGYIGLAGKMPTMQDQSFLS